MTKEKEEKQRSCAARKCLTSKYQEALDDFDTKMLVTDSPVFSGATFRRIREVLQAGAKAEGRGVTLDDLISAHVEGRIFPKLPDYAVCEKCCQHIDDKYDIVLVNDKHIICSKCDNAIDKIGGEV